MNKSTLIGLLVLFLMIGTVTSPVFATTYTIYDKYWGAKDHGYGDIIGEAKYFDISKMMVTYESGQLKYVDIYSRYFNDIGVLGSELGDLFISTDGWNPWGTEPYKDDKYDNGEDWEYALVLDEHADKTKTKGDFDLYQITDSDIYLSNHFKKPNWAYYREEQEVRVNTSSLTPLATDGEWTLNFQGSGDLDDYIRFDLSKLSSFSFTGFPGAFHYGPTCANDVIEGVIPEPSTLFLLGTGLIGFGVFARFRRRKK